MSSKSGVPREAVTTLKAAEVLRALAAEGYSVTRQRRQLVDLILSRPGRFTADDLLNGTLDFSVRVGRATLFRTLDLLANLGFLSRVSDGDHLAYTVCDPTHHHHLVCADCSRVFHLEDCPISDLLAELESRTGYRIKDHRLDVAGICPACQQTDPA